MRADKPADARFDMTTLQMVWEIQNNLGLRNLKIGLLDIFSKNVESIF